MKITNRHDVPIERNNNVIENQEEQGKLIAQDFAKKIADKLPIPSLKGGEGESLFYEETFYIYNEDKINGISKLLNSIVNSNDLQQMKNLARLSFNHLNSKE